MSGGMGYFTMNKATGQIDVEKLHLADVDRGAAKAAHTLQSDLAVFLQDHDGALESEMATEDDDPTEAPVSSAPSLLSVPKSTFATKNPLGATGGCVHP